MLLQIPARCRIEGADIAACGWRNKILKNMRFIRLRNKGGGAKPARAMLCGHKNYAGLAGAEKSLSAG
jgi:hypothetical protein